MAVVKGRPTSLWAIVGPGVPLADEVLLAIRPLGREDGVPVAGVAVPSTAGPRARIPLEEVDAHGLVLGMVATDVADGEAVSTGTRIASGHVVVAIGRAGQAADHLVAQAVGSPSAMARVPFMAVLPQGRPGELPTLAACQDALVHRSLTTAVTQEAAAMVAVAPTRAVAPSVVVVGAVRVKETGSAGRGLVGRRGLPGRLVEVAYESLPEAVFRVPLSLRKPRQQTTVVRRADGRYAGHKARPPGEAGDRGAGRHVGNVRRA